MKQPLDQLAGCTHLMSLHSQWAQAIYAGTKPWEFRRGAPRLAVGDVVAIYETAPTRQITGQFTVAEVATCAGDPAALIALEPNAAAREHLAAYLAGDGICCAFRVSAVELYEQPILLAELGMTRGPMSYQRLGVQLSDLGQAPAMQQPAAPHSAITPKL